MDQNIVRKAHELNMAVRENAKEYFHSSPVVVSETELVLPDRTVHPFQVIYGIKDVLLIGALTHSSVLMTGDTDCGKTTLAKLVQNALFGKEDEGWHRMDVDTDFRLSELCKNPSLL